MLAEENYKDEFAEVCVAGNRLITGSSTGSTRVWKIELPQPIEIAFEEYSDRISSILVVGDILYTASKDGELRLRSLIAGQELARYQSDHGTLQSYRIVCNSIRIVYGRFNTLNVSEDSSSSTDHEMVTGDDDPLETEGITIEVRDLATGELRALYKHLCGGERPVEMNERWIVFGSRVPQTPTTIVAMRAHDLSDEQEWEIDSGESIDQEFYPVKTYIQGSKIIAVTSHGMIRVWDLSVLDKLRTLNRKEAQRLFTKLFEIVARANDNENLSIQQCWNQLAALFRNNQ